MTKPTTILFIGDSITDADRLFDPEGLGNGYVRLLQEALETGRLHSHVLNVGIGGDRVRDLLRRWETDCLAHLPTLVSILVGVNDTWRRYEANDPTPAAAFERDYEAILRLSRSAGIEHVVLCDPFLLPMTVEQQRWRREDLDAKVAIVGELAERYGTGRIRLQEGFDQVAYRARPSAWTRDGVHPTLAGHRFIAQQWLTGSSQLLASLRKGSAS